MVTGRSADFTSALDDFRRARRRADMEQVMARLTGKSADLLSFEEVRKKLKAKQSKTMELKEIPLNAIVGSVGRYHDFTRSFLPRQDSDAERWARVEMTVTDLRGMPPIMVYQVGQAYFVDDGHHRVSVARQLGVTRIRAYVTKVHTKVPLSPDIQPDDLIVKAQYTDFLEHTHLDELRPGADLSMSVPGQYRALEEQILVHHYVMGMQKKRDVPYAEAVKHWYDSVYLPVVHIIQERGILKDFPKRTEADLYLWIVEHRAMLEDELGWAVRPEAAADDMAALYSSRPHRIIARVGEKILEATGTGELEPGPPAGAWRKERLVSPQSGRLFADILVPVSGKGVSWNALTQALEIAQLENAHLHGLHVVSSKNQLDSPSAQAVQSEFDRRCKEAGIPGELTIESGKVSTRICERARWTDLVVVHLAYPPAPKAVSRLQSGIRTLIQRCPRPVLAVPRKVSPLDRALLAYDGSPKAEEALFIAAYLAGQKNIPLVVVTVTERGHTASKMQTWAQEYLEEHAVQAVYVRKKGPVAEAVLKVAEEHKSNLLIMGGYGFNPVLEVALGSAVDQVLRQSRKPMLICR